MQIAEVQFTSWDKVYYFDLNNLTLKVGDKVIVKTELGLELGEIVGLPNTADLDLSKMRTRKKSLPENSAGLDTQENNEKAAEESSPENKFKPVIRLANVSDIGKIASLADKKEALAFAKKAKEKYDLHMKFIDVHFAFDASRLTFAFIADGRVDFREMVKDMTRHFGRTIRLQQIGIRDEARIMGDVGHCGLGICCRGHLKTLDSISSEMAELQQCSHRGSERISGACGRLMCCLSYEQAGYEELKKKMPEIGTKVNVDGKRGVIIGQHVLKQSVNVEFKGGNGDDRTIVEIDLNRNKK